MYLNAYQKYIEELTEEYGSLLISQLLKAVNGKFSVELPNLDGYVGQMCRFGDYAATPYGSEAIFHLKGTEPDYDMIRSFEVLMSFFPNVVWHRKSRFPISICAFLHTTEHDKELFIIRLWVNTAEVYSAGFTTVLPMFSVLTAQCNMTGILSLATVLKSS